MFELLGIKILLALIISLFFTMLIWQINMTNVETDHEKTKRKRKLIAYSVILLVLIVIALLLPSRHHWTPITPVFGTDPIMEGA